MNKAIQLEPYNEKWPHFFQREEKAIRSEVPYVLDIYHIGSTSVPGLTAKPIIDIIGVVRERESAVEPLKKLGYAFKGEYNIPFRSYFNKEGVNLHLYEQGHPEIELNLVFRDFLRNHSEERDAYAALKAKLAEDPNSHKKNGMFKTYTLAKDAFIKSCLKKAGYKGVRFLKAAHHDEKDLARKYCTCIENPEYDHLVLYQGIALVGYGHVDRNQKKIRLWTKEKKWDLSFRHLILSWLNKEHYDNRRTSHPWSFIELE